MVHVLRRCPAGEIGPILTPMARSKCALLALLLFAGAAWAEPVPGPDEPVIRQLNDDYVRAGVLADGRVIDKAEFLREASEKPDAADLRLHDVTIRSYGDSAMVMAFVTYRRHDGSLVRTRYSTLYARRDGRWSIAWVQWTRVTAA